jgi:membrane protease YdiL (CAAX protease family)
LQSGLRPGIALGLAGFAVLFVLTAAKYQTALLHLRLPRDLAIWLNPIITAPLAEELVFRGVVFRILRDRFGVKIALPARSLLFALIHLPYWCAGGKSASALAVELSVMAAYGEFFAGLLQWSDSLWSPLICHWLNNLLMMSIPH